MRAAELAAAELEAWTGVESEVKTRIEDRTGLSEERPGAAVIMDLHPDELRALTSVRVEVAPCFDEWSKRRRAEGLPSFRSPEVTIRASTYGTTLDVRGEDRTRVEGLRQRLSETLGRATTNWVDRTWIPAIAVPTTLLAALGAVLVFRWLRLLPPSPDRATAGEITVFVGGLALGALLCVGAWWLFPPIEMFDEGGAGRVRRFRGATAATASALVVALVGSFLYDQLK